LRCREKRISINKHEHLSQELKLRYESWSTAVRRLTTNRICSVIIFINDMTEIEYGSVLQKKVCESLKIADTMAEDFWNAAGSRAVEEAIRRKRNTLTNALKNAFRKYCNSPWKDERGELIPPPNPLKMIPSGMWKGKDT
jgi:hypothetical protein